MLLLPILAEAQANASGAQVDAAASRASSTLARGDDLLVTDLPSVVEVDNSPLPGLLQRRPERCVRFAVRNLSPKPVVLVRVTSTGMAGARLLDAAGPAATVDCAASYARAATSVAVAGLGDDEHPLLLLLPDDAFPQATSGAKGKILLLRPDRPPIEATLTLRRNDYPPYLRAFLWILSVAVPLLVSGWLTLRIFAAQKRIESDNAEREAFNQYRQDMATELEGFFDGLYVVIMKTSDDAVFRQKMQQEFDRLKLNTALPRTGRTRVLSALKRGDRMAFANALSAQLPDFKEKILKPVP